MNSEYKYMCICEKFSSVEVAVEAFSMAKLALLSSFLL